MSQTQPTLHANDGK
jgi:hypothetical protein